jgi:hypothetical protein
VKLSPERGSLRSSAARLIALTGVLLGATPLHAEPPALPAQPSSPTTRLADLAWFEGHWRDESGGTLSEEIWTAPAGDSLLGMWRLAQDGKVRIFELLAIKAEDGKLVIRLRHFDPKLVAREEKAQPIVWPLVRSGPREVVFEGPEASGKGTVRLTYRRPDDDTLVAILEKGGKPQEFRYRRVTR